MPAQGASVPRAKPLRSAACREDRERAFGIGLHDYIECFGRADTEFVDDDRSDIVAVGLHHGYGEARNAHIENAHRGAVDEAQPHALAGPEQCCPVGRRRLAVDEVGVGGTRDIENVGRAHAHLAPFETIRDRRREASLLHILEEGADGALPEIVVVALKFQVADDRLWTFVAQSTLRSKVRRTPPRLRHSVAPLLGYPVIGVGARHRVGTDKPAGAAAAVTRWNHEAVYRRP
jgi:hypothetical protein